MELRLKSEEQKRKVLENENLVYHALKQLHIDSYEYEDVVSVGKIGLIKAVATFDDENGAKFSTYAIKCIHNEVFGYFKDEKKYKGNISLETPLYAGRMEESEIKLGDVLTEEEKEPEEEIAITEMFVKIVDVVLNLFKSNKRLIMLYTISGLNQTEIAKILNISRARVSLIEITAKEEIRRSILAGRRFKKTFEVEKIYGCYKITFSLNNFENYEGNSQLFLNELKKHIPNVRVDCKNEKITITIPSALESFYMIAKIIKGLDESKAKESIKV